MTSTMKTATTGKPNVMFRCKAGRHKECDLSFCACTCHAQPPERDTGLRDDAQLPRKGTELNTATVTDYCKCGHAPYAHFGMRKKQECLISDCDCALYQRHDAQPDTGQPGREEWQISGYAKSDRSDGQRVVRITAPHPDDGGQDIAEVLESLAPMVIARVNSHTSLIAALERTQRFLLLLTDAGVLDQIAAEHSHPDEVNGLCDAVGEALKHAREGE